jgi:hypothetical protein
MDEVTYYSVCTLGVSIFMGVGIKVALDDIFHSEQQTKEPCSTQTTDLLTFCSDTNVLSHQGEPILKIKNGSTNHRLIKYLFSHQDQEIPLSTLYQKIGLSEDTYINKLIANTKLPKDIRCKAFSIKNDTILFTTHFN